MMGEKILLYFHACSTTWEYNACISYTYVVCSCASNNQYNPSVWCDISCAPTLPTLQACGNDENVMFCSHAPKATTAER